MIFENIQPETEALIQQYLLSGQFHDINELLAKAIGALRDRETELPVAAQNQAERRMLEGRKSLPQLFAESPFKGLNIEFDESEHDKDFGRNIEL